MTSISKLALAIAVVLALSPTLAMADGADLSHHEHMAKSDRADAGRDSRKEDKAGSKDNRNEKGDARGDSSSGDRNHNGSGDRSGDGNRGNGKK
jgi:hypothetical protein